MEIIEPLQTCNAGDVYSLPPLPGYGSACWDGRIVGLRLLGDRMLDHAQMHAYMRKIERVAGRQDITYIRYGWAGYGSVIDKSDGSGSGVGDYPACRGRQLTYGDGSTFGNIHGAGKGCPFNRLRGHGRGDDGYRPQLIPS